MVRFLLRLFVDLSWYLCLFRSFGLPCWGNASFFRFVCLCRWGWFVSSCVVSGRPRVFFRFGVVFGG